MKLNYKRDVARRSVELRSLIASTEYDEEKLA
jgi:hypothetical protein